jgi:hypothetical protein
VAEKERLKKAQCPMTKAQTIPKPQITTGMLDLCYWDFLGHWTFDIGHFAAPATGFLLTCLAGGG